MRYAVRPGSRVGQLALASWGALVDLALPRSCGGCETPGPPWCDACDDELRGALHPLGAGAAAPTPCPAGLPPTWAAAAYDGPLRAALVAYKDADRRDLARVLAAVLAGAMGRALDADPVVRTTLASGNGPVLAVPVPSSGASLRRRGDAPLLRLLGDACSSLDPAQRLLLPAPALRLRRRVADQAGLDHRARAANLEHAMEARGRWQPVLPGTTCLLVDDVLTTGATLVEAARALRRAGAGHVVAVTAAATQRRGIRGRS